MNGYIITKQVLGRWTYYLSGLNVDGKPVWNGLKNNGKTFTLLNAGQVKDKLNDIFPMELFEIIEG